MTSRKFPVIYCSGASW